MRRWSMNHFEDDDDGSEGSAHDLAEDADDDGVTRGVERVDLSGDGADIDDDVAGAEGGEEMLPETEQDERIEKARAAKERGNAHYAAGEWVEAIEAYGEAIELSRVRVRILIRSVRAMLGLHMWGDVCVRMFMCVVPL